MNRKNIPLIMMLVAGLVTIVITYIRQYSILSKLAVLFAVMLVFYCLGSILVWFLDHFDAENEKRNVSEGEVIEKDADPEAPESLGSDSDQEEQTI